MVEGAHNTFMSLPHAASRFLVALFPPAVLRNLWASIIPQQHARESTNGQLSR